MSEFWKEQTIERQLLPEEKRYNVYFDSARQTWNIIDMTMVPEDQLEPPEDAYIAIPQPIVRELLTEIADTDLIDHILADKTYQKDVEEKHLEMLDKLIDKIG